MEPDLYYMYIYTLFVYIHVILWYLLACLTVDAVCISKGKISRVHTQLHVYQIYTVHNIHVHTCIVMYMYMLSIMPLCFAPVWHVNGFCSM